jgi:hypothetical protein
MELPGDSWAGWCFHGGKLWTPEGRSFVGTDASWWSLLVRRAAMFDELCRAGGSAARAPQARRAADAPTMDVPHVTRYSVATPASAALYSARQLPSNSPAFSAPRLRQAGVVAPPDSLIYETAHVESNGLKSKPGEALRTIRRA